MAPRKAPRAKSATTSLHQLKITLEWSRPAIWRRVVVPSDMMLDRLHDVIQIAMGWTDSHMHQFRGEGVRGGRGPGFGEFDDETGGEEDHTLADLAPKAKSRFTYEYDFGDGWLHEVKVEKILAPDPTFKHPICLAGENACPPEDSGGIPGYHLKLESLADPKDPDHEEVKDWLGDDWDPTHFDIARVNAALKRIKA